MDEVKVYTLNEVAGILKITKRTIYNYLKAGQLKAVKVGKLWRVSDTALREFISTGSEVPEENKRKAQQTA